MEDKVAKRVSKHIIPGKVQNWDQRIFTIEKVADHELGIVVQFSRRVDYKVVKLSIAGLPTRDTDGKKINWLNNFGVTDSKGRYVNRVHYTVFLPASKEKMTYVYHDHRGLRHGKAPKAKGTKPAQPGMVQVDFNTGDPAVGCK
jgi:hypothetical protein